MTAKKSKKAIAEGKPGLPAPFYQQQNGAAYLGDSLQLMQQLPSTSVNLVEFVALANALRGWS